MKEEMQATEVFELIQAEAKRIAESTPKIRFVRTVQIGQWIRQGDVYLTRVDKMPPGKVIRTDSVKLHPGASDGSRHMAEGNLAYVDIRGPLEGPVIECPERFLVTHPEHIHFSLPSGIYQTTYQRDLELEGIRAVED